MLENKSHRKRLFVFILCTSLYVASALRWMWTKVCIASQALALFNANEMNVKNAE